MDFPRNLFANDSCAGELNNPLSKAIDHFLSGGELDAGFQGQTQSDLFEDAWDTAELAPHLAQGPGFDELWEHSAPQPARLLPLAESLQESTSSILAALESQADPKFTNSEFYKFVSKLNSGQVEIEGNELVEHWGDVWDAQENTLQTAWEHTENTQLFENHWGTQQDEATALWAKAWEDSQTKYSYQDFNPYLELPNPFEVGLEKLRSGLTQDAVLCFEAEAHKSPENSVVWAYLGKLHLENDDDDRARDACLRGLGTDPYNLHLLMTLGVANTNNFDSQESHRNFRSWLEGHPEYNAIPTATNVRTSFEMARELNPSDVNVHSILGTLHFLEGDLRLALDSFRNACNLKPHDPSLWNKLGAALCKSGDTEGGLDCYYRALELRPDYIRAWTNIALSHYNSGDYHAAARFYLCAAALNPEAGHLFNLLETTFRMMEREDLTEKLRLKDPLLFSDEFNVVVKEELPRPLSEFTLD